MNTKRRTGAEEYASSTGQLMTDAGWLDAHFETCRPEYEAMLRSVGIQPGWHILDAGSGSGSFLPLLSELAGPSGRIAALDLAPDNVATVERRVAAWDLPTPVEARVGSVLALPYDDAGFDAVWCAATSQYLTDAELAATLAECRRVVRPGGLMAIKDVDGTMIGFTPAPPLLIAHLFEAMAAGGNVQFAGCLRVPSLASRLRWAGFGAVWQRTTLVERSAPLRAVERQYIGDGLAYFAPTALQCGLPAADQAAWEELTAAAGRDRLFDDPDFSWREGHVVAVGIAP
jgi:arsenite methyltransferase